MNFCRVLENELPSNDEDAIVSYVLSDFIPAEVKIIKLAIAIATIAEAANCFLTEGIIAAMNEFN